MFREKGIALNAYERIKTLNQYSSSSLTNQRMKRQTQNKQIEKLGAKINEIKNRKAVKKKKKLCFQKKNKTLVILATKKEKRHKYQHQELNKGHHYIPSQTQK